MDVDAVAAGAQAIDVDVDMDSTGAVLHELRPADRRSGRIGERGLGVPSGAGGDDRGEREGEECRGERRPVIRRRMVSLATSGDGITTYVIA